MVLNKLLARMVEDGADALIFRLDAGNVSLIYRGDTLWVDVDGRPACQIDLYHLTPDNSDSERYAQVVLESEHGEDPVGYHRLLAQGNVTVFEPDVKTVRVDWDGAKYYGYDAR